MITRIVKLSIKEENKNEFISLFKKFKNDIVSSEGCFEVEFFQDKSQSSIFFTVSRWKNENALELYRNSALFELIWPTVKPMFIKKAEAWTIQEV